MDTKGRTYFLPALLIGATAVSFLVFRPFLTTVALAAVFAVVFYPVYTRILTKLGSHKSIAALLTVLVAIVIILIPLTFVGALITDQVLQTYNSFASGENVASLQTVASTMGSWFEPYIPGATSYIHSLTLEVNSYVQTGLQWLIQRIGVAFTSILGILLRVLIFLMALYYLLRDGAMLEKLLVKQSPLKDEEGSLILKHLARTIGSVVKGSLVIACIQGTLAGIGYMLFGVPNAAIWGISTAVAALIPGVGTSLIIVPSVIYLFAAGMTSGAIGLLLWGTLLVGLIDNFLAPRLMGKGAQMHPLVILLSVLGGVILFGPTGIFLGPLTSSFLIAVYTVYSNRLTPEA